MQTLFDVAQALTRNMETATRANGSRYVRRVPEAEEWTLWLLKSVHGDSLPDDYIYAWTYEAAEYLRDNGSRDMSEDEARDLLTDWAHEEADQGEYSLLKWLGSSPQRMGLCDPLLAQGFDCLRDLIGAAMAAERMELAGRLLRQLQWVLDTEAA